MLSLGSRKALAEEPPVRPDAELEGEIAEIDRMLESQSAWLTPRCRSALLGAREVLVETLSRRNRRWPPLAFAPEAAERPRALGAQ